MESNKQKVLRALENPEWEWRTVTGVAAETGLDPEEVVGILEESPDEVIRSEVPDARGRPLYTTRRHYRRTQNVLNRFRRS
jgi:hypothetical protein